MMITPITSAPKPPEPKLPVLPLTTQTSITGLPQTTQTRAGSPPLIGSITRQEEAPSPKVQKVVQFAGILPPTASGADGVLPSFLHTLKGKQHLTPWKRVDRIPFKTLPQGLTLLKANLSLADMIGMEAVDAGLREVYETIRLTCREPQFQDLFPFHHHEKIAADRHAGTIPYAYNCVTLSDGRYINASLVESIIPFIMTQAPIPPIDGKPGTLEEFWTMAWEKGSRQIVMLNRNEDEEYWPEFLNTPVTHGPIEVTLVGHDSSKPGTIVRTINLKNNATGEVRTLKHTQKIDWPDNGIPRSIENLLEFLQEFDALHGQAPVIVHCEKGGGRSSTFILLYTIVNLLKRLPPDAHLFEYEINLASWFLWIRSQRTNAISTLDQYFFIYEVVRKVAHQMDDLQNL